MPTCLCEACTSWRMEKATSVPAQLAALASEAEPPVALEALYGDLLRSTEGSIRSGTERTAARASAAWSEMTRGYDVDVAKLMTTFDAEGFDEMVLVRGCPVWSLCEHHLLPFHERTRRPSSGSTIVSAICAVMAMRGAMVPGSTTTTSAVRGVLKDKPEARAEALNLIGGTR